MKLLSIFESAPEPRRMNSSFNVGDVAFDNKNGLGSTPMGQNVIYLGAVAWLKPSVFRKLATQADRADTTAELVKLMKSGKPIACPFLELDIVGEPDAIEKVKVVGHEGRARADAFKSIAGDVPMPVQLFPRYFRARHLGDDFFQWIEAHGLIAERSTEVVKPRAKLYYCAEREVTI